MCMCWVYVNITDANSFIILLHYFMQVIPRMDQLIKKNKKKINVISIGWYVSKLKMYITLKISHRELFQVFLNYKITFGKIMFRS